jgi:aryl-alcohol dehydrogenase-like predicted oxidoreductase
MELIQDQVHEYFVSKNFEKNLKIVDCLKDIGNKYRVSPAQVAIKWVMDIGFIDITLVGCKTPEQVLSNVDVFNFDLTDTDKKSLSDLLGIKN